VSIPLRAITHAITEFEFHMSPVASSSRPHEGVLDGLAAGQEDIFPDSNAQAMATTWWADPKTFERAFSGA
jgi:hypothetical protein